MLRDRANLLVHLRPAPVVARIPALTALVRPNPEEWLSREVAVAGFADARGAPVIGPTDELPPGPHRCDGMWMTFSRFVEEVPASPPDAATYGRLLRRLHDALDGFAPALPRLVPLTEIPAMLTAAESTLDPADVASLREAYRHLALPLLAGADGVAALHGDSNVHNLVATATGWRWSDFEDAGSGPVAWDLACAVCAGAPDREALLRGYGVAVDPEELDAYVAARDLQAIPWLFLVGSRFPAQTAEGRRRRAALRR